MDRLRQVVHNKTPESQVRLPYVFDALAELSSCVGTVGASKVSYQVCVDLFIFIYAYLIILYVELALSSLSTNLL